MQFLQHPLLQLWLRLQRLRRPAQRRRPDLPLLRLFDLFGRLFKLELPVLRRPLRPLRPVQELQLQEVH